ncbi:hypothetical protein J6590_093922 [Homalodisca vitripennis]|nr:hypothetical protein J6590_093922 [Homalodisca vitripennis]
MVLRVTASARYTAPRNDATPLLREQSVTFIAPRNTMETIASSAKSAKFSEEEDELLVFEVQERPILWSLQQKEYKNVLKKDKEWELIGKKLSKTESAPYLKPFTFSETTNPGYRYHVLFRHLPLNIGYIFRVRGITGQKVIP